MNRKQLGASLAALVTASALVATAVGLATQTAVATAPDDGSDDGSARATAHRLIERDAPALKIGDHDGFKALPVVASGGVRYAPYERTYRGLPVIGGDFVVVTRPDGTLLDTSVAQSAETELASVTPRVSKAVAARTARGRLAKVTGTEGTRLVVWQAKHSTLAWETTVTGRRAGEDSRLSVYVDAVSGKVVGTVEHVVDGTGTAAYSGPNPISFNTTNSSGTYSLRDTAATSLVCQDNATSTTFSGPDDVWGNGNATSKETGCVDGFYAAQQLRQMMSSWLGRSGMNGSGGWVPLRVGLNDINAYYDGTQVKIGHNQSGQWISSIDVVAHEYGHGVDDHTPGGISGSGTQEFVADVFGAATEFYDNQSATYDGPDWTVGEEVNLVGQGPIRNMANPGAVGDPNCYSSSIPSAEVHAAAGPGDHWFYLLSAGGTSRCDGTSVSGLGVQKAAKIMYNAMLTKTSSSSYLKYRTWTLTAAKNLYPSSCVEFIAVKTAWDAVNVPAQSGDPTCGSTPPPTGSNLLANPGFESGSGVGWSGTSGPITNNTGRPAHTGSWKMWLGGNGTTSSETEQQTVSIPATATAAPLSYWIRTDTAESGSTVYDTMKVQVVVGGVTTTLKSFSNVGTNATYTKYSHSLLAYKGKSVTVRFVMSEDSSLQTSFVVDDTAVTIS